MRELLIQKWCDACFQDGEIRTPSRSTLTIAMQLGEGRPPAKIVELCEIHEKLVADLLPLVAAVAELALDQPAKPLKRSEAAPRSASPTTCPVCDRSYTVKASVTSHLWQEHRPGEKRFPPDLRCPDCGQRASSTVTYSTHRANEHGLAAAVLALEGVRGWDRAKAQQWERSLSYAD